MTKKFVAPIALPFDVPGNTSAGKLTVAHDADITIPEVLAQIKLWNVHPGSDELDPATEAVELVIKRQYAVLSEIGLD